jgi:hypothetical protein
MSANATTEAPRASEAETAPYVNHSLVQRRQQAEREQLAREQHVGAHRKRYSNSSPLSVRSIVETALIKSGAGTLMLCNPAETSADVCKAFYAALSAKFPGLFDYEESITGEDMEPVMAKKYLSAFRAIALEEKRGVK